MVSSLQVSGPEPLCIYHCLRVIYVPQSSHPPWFDHSNIWKRTAYILRSSSLWNFLQPSVNSALLGANIASNVVSDTLNPSFFPLMQEAKFHTHKAILELWRKRMTRTAQPGSMHLLKKKCIQNCRCKVSWMLDKTCVNVKIIQRYISIVNWLRLWLNFGMLWWQWYALGVLKSKNCVTSSTLYCGMTMWGAWASSRVRPQWRVL